MSTVVEILEAVKRLPEEQKGEFLDRLRQIEADAKAGRLGQEKQTERLKTERLRGTHFSVFHLSVYIPFAPPAGPLL